MMKLLTIVGVFLCFVAIRADDEAVVIESVEVINVTDTSATFLITSTGTNNEFNVKFIEKVENKTIQSTHSGNTFTIEELIPSGSYTFQFSPKVTAEEEIVWTNNYTVVLFPGVPDVIFRSLNGGVLNIEWFRKIDDFGRQTIDKYHLSYYTVQMYHGNEWTRNDCKMALDIPRCFCCSYTIPNLFQNSYYEIVLKAHTSAGYGKPYINKIRII